MKNASVLDRVEPWLTKLRAWLNNTGTSLGAVQIFGAVAEDDARGESPGPQIKGEALAALTIIGVFFVGFFGWAAIAPLQTAAIAPGVLSVDGYRKTIQHLEGGIVGEILVREGDEVSADQVLIQLADTSARATLELLLGRWMVASSLEARLFAERDGQMEIVFPKALLDRKDDPKVAQIIEGQNNIFTSRSEVLMGQGSILDQRGAQLEEEIKGIRGQIRAEDAQLKLIKVEIKDIQALYKKGFARKPRLLQLQRRAAEIEGSRNLHQAQIARAKQSIAESKMRVAELRTSMLNEVAEELRRVQGDLYDLGERLRAAKDVLARTAIRSPIAGTVVNLQVHTPGGVIGAGAPLLDIVPSERRLVVEAQIDPNDIDIVRAGLGAQVRFTAFNQRHRPAAIGTVTSVSADRLTDEASGENYYLARIELAEVDADGAETDELRPGMQAEVMIVTGERTALDYLVEPFSRSFNRAFREN